jgi:hypothetical protein
MSNEPTNTTETTDPAELPFGAPFAAWVSEHVTPKAVVAEDGTKPSPLQRVIWKHADRRADAGLGQAMEDLLFDAITRLRDSAQWWRKDLGSAQRALAGANPLSASSADIPDQRALAISYARVDEASRHLRAVVNAYVATAAKLAVIGDEERSRAAQRRAEARVQRENALSVQSLDTLRAIAANVGATASGPRKGPWVDAILKAEFAEVQS